MAKKDPMPELLRHWREAVPDDRLAHLIRDVARAQMRALQLRLAEHGVSFGHWTFLRILWLKDGLTQRELSELAGVMEPTTFAAVKAMEGMGLIERRQLAGNRKNMHVFLTRRARPAKETGAAGRGGQPHQRGRQHRGAASGHAAVPLADAGKPRHRRRGPAALRSGRRLSRDRAAAGRCLSFVLTLRH